ncbi:MAG: hypothetical protein RLZZ229_777, partial [Actinomycetota bacterium]
MNEEKLLPVPEGLVGERVDAGVAKLLGLSRSVVADMVVDGLVKLNGKT